MRGSHRVMDLSDLASSYFLVNKKNEHCQKHKKYEKQKNKKWAPEKMRNKNAIIIFGNKTGPIWLFTQALAAWPSM